MDENPYQATQEFNEEVRPHRRTFGMLILGTLGGAFVGGIVAAVLMSIYRYEIPETPVRDTIFSYIPVTCVVTLACIGAMLGAFRESRS